MRRSTRYSTTAAAKEAFLANPVKEEQEEKSGGEASTAVGGGGSEVGQRQQQADVAVQPKGQVATSSTSAAGAGSSAGAKAPLTEGRRSTKKRKAASPLAEISGQQLETAGGGGDGPGGGASGPTADVKMEDASDEGSGVGGQGVEAAQADAAHGSVEAGAVADASPPSDNLPPWQVDASEDNASEDEQPARKKKKPAKKLEKKVVKWTELLVPSTVSFQAFPNEILSHIISVDADLELRDHVALAATCKFFRTCYNDRVWQILFSAAFPEFIADITACRAYHAAETGYEFDDIYMRERKVKTNPSQLRSYVSGRTHYYAGPLRSGYSFGPFNLGWRAARYIFSSGTDGATGAARWGQSKAEWDAGQAARDAQEEEVLEAIRTDPKLPRSIDYLSAMMKVSCLYAGRTALVDPTDEEKKKHLYYATAVEDKAKREAYEAARASRADEGEGQSDVEPELFDPWPSPWRSLVADIVNKPVLTKTDAKKHFKVQDRELLAIPLVKPKPYEYTTRPIPARGGYRLATLQCLSMRSHGGAKGHEEHVHKLEERRRKAAATRAKNGTAKKKKQTPSFYSGMFLHEDDYYSDEGYYGGW